MKNVPFKWYLNSMRLRLALIFSTIIVVLLFIVFGFIYYVLHKNFKDEAVAIIDERVLLITDLLKDNPDGLRILKNKIEKEWIGSREPLWIQIKLPDGSLFAESPQYSQRLGEAYFKSDRALNLRQFNPSIPYLKIAMKFDRSNEQELLVSIGKQMITLFILVIFFSIYLTFKIISREIFPLIKMSKKMKYISLRSLHKRINSQKFPMELEPVAQSFNTMLNELQKSFDQISTFSADIAHELRTPLNALMIKLEVMMEKPRSTAEYQELLESLHQDTRGLSKLIDILLFLSRAENPGLVLNFETLKLNQEVNSLVDFYEALASEKNIQIEIDCKENIFIDVEKSLFDRALGNLLQNAIQYCAVGSRLKIQLQTNSEETVVRVIDNGPGIDAKHLPFIFNRLYRVDSSRSTDSGGLGLGLSIVSSIMKLHGGRVNVQSDIGIGSVFELVFPRVKKLPNKKRHV